MRLRIAMGVLLCLLGTSTVRAQQADSGELPEAAQERLASLVGKWSSRWERLDAQGNVRSVATGTEVGRYAQGKWLVEWTTEVVEENGDRRLSKAWWFYSKKQNKIYLTSVSEEGDLWILSGDPVDFVITSWPRKTADGGEMIIRFLHDKSADGTVHAVMEWSTDNGTTWTRGFRQTMTPVG